MFVLVCVSLVLTVSLTSWCSYMFRKDVRLSNVRICKTRVFIFIEFYIL